MHIVLFGGSGGTGKQVVAQALKAGHTITALMRNPQTFAVQNLNLKIIKADVFQYPSFAHVIKEGNVVVSCLGAKDRKPTTVYSEGMRNIMTAMKEANVQRIICLSAGAVVVPPKGSALLKFVTKNILQRLFKHLYTDMLLMES